VCPGILYQHAGSAQQLQRVIVASNNVASPGNQQIAQCWHADIFAALEIFDTTQHPPLSHVIKPLYF
jgi:hypothetical protein